MTIYIRKILDERDLNYIRENSENLEWADGVWSVHGGKPDEDGFGSKFKKVMESTDPTINDLLMTRLDDDLEFHTVTVGKSSTSAILSKICEGGYYRPHVDDPTMGDFSTTIFLSDPDTYDGGELNLLVDSEVKKIKLEAGWGITYTTGIPHEVAEVTRGCRNAAVFWTKSHIKDDSIRSIYSQAHRLEQMLEVTDVLTLEQQETHPFAIARNLRSQLQRKFCK